MAFVTRKDIFDYIPQRDPICLVHTIYECDSESVRTGFNIESGHFFVSNDVLMEAGIVENLAQSCASQAGYFAKQAGGEPKVGYIANIKNLQINFLPPVNSELVSEVRVTNKVMNVTLVNAVSTCNGKEVARCEMKIFLQE
jgi:predicted hotdog family 3-hydroxylacyl-ACP dehydratase